MKKTLGYLLASLVVVFVSMPAFAGTGIEWSGNVSTGIEKLSYGCGDTYTWGSYTYPVDNKLQFTSALVNLDVKADIADGVVAVGQLRNYGYYTDYDMGLFRAAYLELGKIIPNATLMVGKVMFPMGKEADSQTEGANMMNNAMIGDSALFDAGMTGQMIDYGMALKTAFGPANCLLAITNGNYGLASDNNSKKAMAIRLDGDVPAIEGLSLAASYGQNDASEENWTDKMTGLVLDAAYKTGACKLAVTYADGETKTTVKDKTKGTGIEASYAVNDTCSLAARYGKVEMKEDEVKTSEVTKIQGGVNYKLAENTMLKVEYVKNELKEETTDIDTPADYNGLKAAVAVKF